jgi:hypothetical protein
VRLKNPPFSLILTVSDSYISISRKREKKKEKKKVKETKYKIGSMG